MGKESTAAVGGRNLRFLKDSRGGYKPGAGGTDQGGKLTLCKSWEEWKTLQRRERDEPQGDQDLRGVRNRSRQNKQKREDQAKGESVAKGVTEVKGSEDFKREEVSLGTNGTKGHLKTQKKTKKFIKTSKTRVENRPRVRIKICH